MNCWICQEHETCPYPVCAEQETADRVKNDEIQLEIEFADRDNSETSRQTDFGGAQRGCDGEGIPHKPYASA